MTDNDLIVLHPCPATAQYQGCSQAAVTLNEILYSSIPLLIQSGISLAIWLCGIWSRWAASLQMLTDIPFHLRPRPALSFMAVSLTERERAEEKAMETLFQTLAVMYIISGQAHEV